MWDNGQAKDDKILKSGHGCGDRRGERLKGSQWIIVTDQLWGSGEKGKADF